MPALSRPITLGVLAISIALFASVGPRVGVASGVSENPAALSGELQPAQEVTETPAPDIYGLIEANGRLLYLTCLGSGTPTIVLETGEGGTTFDYHLIHGRLSRRTTVCAYDRANNGRSDSAPVPRTAEDIASDLNALLESAHVPGPYLLVGKSAGGLLVQAYARMHPDQVVGVVTMNPVPPAGPWLDAVLEVFTEDEYAGELAYYEGDNGESLDYLTSSEQIADTPPPPEVPFVLLISTDFQCEGESICLKSYGIYERTMADVAEEWPCGQLLQIPALHDMPSDDPDTVIEVIERVLSLFTDSSGACQAIELTAEPRS